MLYMGATALKAARLVSSSANKAGAQKLKEAALDALAAVKQNCTEEPNVELAATTMLKSASLS
jgi:hypothetical protein